jgi:chromosome segregation ATPase
VSNQWGRDTPSITRSRGAPIGTLIAVLLSLGIGAAVGYGALLYGGGTNSGQLDAAEQRVTELNARLAESERQLQQALETARQQAPVDGAYDTGSAELDAMTEKLAQVSAELASEKQRVRELEAEIEAVRWAADERGRAASDALRKMAARDELAELSELRQVKIPRLEAQVGSLMQRLAESQSQLRSERSSVEELSRQRDAARDAQTDAEKALALERSRLVDLQTQLTRMQKAGGESESPQGVVEEKPANAETSSTVNTAGREADLVADALDRTPGIDRLSSADRERLQEMLVSGQCVTTSLKAVFRSVPVVTLRNLMRDLKSGC